MEKSSTASGLREPKQRLLMKPEASQSVSSGILRPIAPGSAREAAVNRYAVLYVATLFVLIPLDFLFLGVVAKPFFKAQVGDMLGDINVLPAALFYPLYVLGTVIFVSGTTTSLQSSLLYGALFGLFAYATFELTALAMLKHWTWPVVFADVSWGMAVTAISATAAVAAANRLAPA